mgnify:CR=1 FL=1
MEMCVITGSSEIKSIFEKNIRKKTDEQGYFYNEYRRSIAKEKYLEETPMLNYSARNIQQLLAERELEYNLNGNLNV